MDALKSLRRKKKRQHLTLSAASSHSGLQCVLVETHRNSFAVVHHEVFPYPEKVRTLVDGLATDSAIPLDIREMAATDLEFSRFMVDSARALLSHVARAKVEPDLLILNRLDTWKGPTGDQAMYLQRKALNALYYIGDRDTARQLQERAIGWSVELELISYLTIESILLRQRQQ